ncbi:hypothetical protein MTR67_053603 [Solanum verrucosum]|uniref:Uncharacterized protein n=1 Tax=Solanum verrucosum TaxID=315347 RepID=A0AAF0R0Z5_SOLVR|nr:hypothetical protein MTR67_001261 [Solanum verrucosum]WMV10274.1 hypothetical protein MTR67_003659 [Solanum verrucosum]WMV10662.1 hypothetical protein MTR67_004047 [Solanum verrucosum]WMV14401.1 hypothetical protein MTR67_007786 [Solanum verrucosum]WMV23740.1 hypothetical protein MTR67_017125 [Solanum verrucosum]
MSARMRVRLGTRNGLRVPATSRV